MKYALLLIELPSSENIHEPEQQQRWQTFLNKISNSGTKIESVALHRQVLWQIPLESDLAFLSQCIAEATREKFGYRVLFLDEEPDWILSMKTKV